MRSDQVGRRTEGAVTVRAGRAEKLVTRERKRERTSPGGQLFGRSQIVRLLGEGGMGAVYEAVHITLKKRFAIMYAQ
jgi:hypothetical protein